MVAACAVGAKVITPPASMAVPIRAWMVRMRRTTPSSRNAFLRSAMARRACRNRDNRVSHRCERADIIILTENERPRRLRWRDNHATKVLSDKLNLQPGPGGVKLEAH